jgi:hypothetical protein
MIQILAKSSLVAKQYANGEEYIIVTTARQLFGNVDKPLHVLDGWEQSKSPYSIGDISKMITSYINNPKASVVFDGIKDIEPEVLDDHDFPYDLPTDQD